MICTFEMEPPEDKLPALYEVLNRTNDNAGPAPSPTGPRTAADGLPLRPRDVGRADGRARTDRHVLIAAVLSGRAVLPRDPAGRLGRNAAPEEAMQVAIARPTGAPQGRAPCADRLRRGASPCATVPSDRDIMTMDRAAGLVLLGLRQDGLGDARGLARIAGCRPASVWVIDPKPSDWLKGTGVNLNADLPAHPAIVLIAVKPQMMGDALPGLPPWAAADAVRVRSPPARPSPGLRGDASAPARPSSAPCPTRPPPSGAGSPRSSAMPMPAEPICMAETLLSAVGQVVRLDDEARWMRSPPSRAPARPMSFT
jgi:hypothetical protein